MKSKLVFDPYGTAQSITTRSHVKVVQVATVGKAGLGPVSAKDLFKTGGGIPKSQASKGFTRKWTVVHPPVDPGN